MCVSLLTFRVAAWGSDQTSLGSATATSCHCGSPRASGGVGRAGGPRVYYPAAGGGDDRGRASRATGVSTAESRCSLSPLASCSKFATQQQQMMSGAEVEGKRQIH